MSKQSYPDARDRQIEELLATTDTRVNQAHKKLELSPNVVQNRLYDYIFPKYGVNSVRALVIKIHCNGYID